MKILIYIALLIIFATQTVSASNNEIKDEILYQKYEIEMFENIDEILSRYEFQFIHSFFGKDYLLAAVSDITYPANIQRLSDMSESEIAMYMTSFADWSKGWQIIKLILVIFITIGFAYFLRSLLATALLTMSSGSLFGGKIPIFSYLTHTLILFICLIQFLVVEIHKPSYIERFIFKKLGNSFVVSNDALNEYHKNIATGLPSIKLPRPYVYRDDMFNLVNALMEEKSVLSEDSEIKINLNKDSERYYGGFIGQQASININIPIDISLINKQTQFLENDISNYYDVKIESVFEEVINKANNVATNVMSQDVINWHKYENSDMRWVSKTCSNYENIDLNGISATSIKEYIEEASKCLSKDLVWLMTAIPDYDYNKIINGDYGLRNNSIQVCSVAQDSYGKRQINTMSHSEIRACMNKYCSDSDKSSVFSCSIATNLYVKSELRSKNSEKGFFQNLIMSPYFSILKIDTSSAESSLNGLSVLEEEPIVSNSVIEFSIPLTKHYGFNSEDYTSFIKDNGVSIIDNINFETLSEINFSDFITGFDGPFGLTRFQTCLNNPNSITDGYICDNIFSEMNDMGNNFIGNAIALKALTPFLSKILKRKNKAISAQILKEKTLTNELRTKALKGGIVGGAVTVGLIDAIENSGVDHFYGWNDNVRDNAPMLAGFIIALSVLEEKFGINLLDTIFFVLMLVGILIGYVFPLVPYIFMIGIVILIARKIYESLIVVVLNFLIAVTPDQKDRSEYLVKAFVSLTALIMIPLFATIAVVVFNIMTQDIIPRFKIFETSSSYGAEGSTAQIVLFVIYAFLSVYFIFRLINYVAGTLNQFVDNSNSMIYGDTRLGSAEEVDSGEEQVKYAIKRITKT